MRPRLAPVVDRTLLAILAEGFFSRLSFALITFALPLYAHRELGMSLSQVGLLASLNLIVAIPLKPLGGSLADRFGYKRSLGVAIALRSAVSLVLAFASAFAWYQTAKGLAAAAGKIVAGVLLSLTAANYSLVFVVGFALSALPIYVV